MRLLPDIEVFTEERDAMKKIHAVETVSEPGVANGATRSPKDPPRVISPRRSPALNRIAVCKVGSVEYAGDACQDARLRNVLSCKDLQKEYATRRERVSRCDEVVPQTLPDAARVRLETPKLIATRGR